MQSAPRMPSPSDETVDDADCAFVPVSPPHEITITDAQPLREIARRGGGRVFVAPPDGFALTHMSKLACAGLIETQQQVNGQFRVRLTSAGVARLPECATLIQNSKAGPSA